MPPTQIAGLDEQRLLRLVKAKKELFLSWDEGISLFQDSGGVLPSQLRLVVTEHRWALASLYLADAKRMHRMRPPPYRSVISRYYYSMYHSMRAAAFISHGGDDFEEHSKLPLNIPLDFPNTQSWQTQLKDARLTRNRADYDPYPNEVQQWRLMAGKIAQAASDLNSDTQGYLRQKGCANV